MREITFSPDEQLLDWYDRHHRDLPWRVSPKARAAGAVPDPYRIWLSEVMLQQTTVAAVKSYFLAFTERWPDVGALAGAANDDVMAAWAGLGYYSRARNLHACAKEVARLGGFPDRAEDLIALPGIGPYTAAAIAAIAFDRKATVMDGNVERVMARRFAEIAPLPGIKETLRAHAASLTPDLRPGDYAQAVMDLGATICTPRNPACGICPWMQDCAARQQGIAATLPRKVPKKAKPIRFGVVHVAMADGMVEVVRRPPKGLLGGMLALPSPEWGHEMPDLAPMPGWRCVGEVRHTFTHFHLRLDVRISTDTDTDPATERMPVDVALDAMPTVFAKALRLAVKGG